MTSCKLKIGKILKNCAKQFLKVQYVLTSLLTFTTEQYKSLAQLLNFIFVLITCNSIPVGYQNWKILADDFFFFAIAITT